MPLAGYGIKSMWVMLKAKMLSFQSKANLDKKMLFAKITHHFDLEIRKTLIRGMSGNRNHT